MRIFTVFSSFLVSLSVGNICAAQSAESPRCLEIRVTKTNSSIVEAPGYYCLKRDLHVDGRLNPFKHGHQLTSDDDVLMTIAHNDVILDMKAFKLTSDAALDAGGIQSPTETFSRVTTGLLRQYPNARFVRNVQIKDGTIDLERGGIAIRFMGYTGNFASTDSDRSSSHPPRIPTEASSLSPPKTMPPSKGELDFYQQLVKDLPKTPLEYPNRAIHIENMTIRTQSIGIVVQGGGTIIRNSVIETFGSAAIWIYGPNALIENNTIIVHSEQPYLSGDAAIRLYHGDGAIIRNNKIIVKGSVHKRAVSTIDTGSFAFDGNTLTGISETDKYAIAVRGDMLGKLNGTVFKRARSWPFD
jgi:Right handed beta helix region